MLERHVKEKVKRTLKKVGAYYHMVVMNGMGAPTLDFIGCYKGYFFAVETKKPGAKPTPRQQITIETMEKSGARVFVIDGEVNELLDWIKTIDSKRRLASS